VSPMAAKSFSGHHRLPASPSRRLYSAVEAWRSPATWRAPTTAGKASSFAEFDRASRRCLWPRRGMEFLRRTGHARAGAARLESNRRLSCAACRPPVHDPPGLPDLSANPRMLQMREGMSGMS
jgi:hypothetical protein